MKRNTAEWISAKKMKPIQDKDNGSASKLVEVLLDTGDIKRDFLIDGKWTYYCEKNPNVPQIVAWRYMSNAPL